MSIVVHKGRTIDSSGNPLWGAHIFSKATNTGATSDFEGNFQIADTAGKKYTISHIGMKSVDITLSSRMVDQVYTLYDNYFELDEVVLTAPRKSSGSLWALLGIGGAILLGNKYF